MLHTPFPDVSQARPGPRLSSIGATFVAAAAVLLPTTAVLSAKEVCAAVPPPGSQAVALVALIALAGVALAVSPARTAAVAPALALGAGTLLLGGAAGASAGLLVGACGGGMPHPPGSLLVVQGGVAVALMCVSVWLLHAGAEFAPWGGSFGVVVATCLAAGTLVVGLGVILLTVGATAEGYVLAASVVLPWSAIVGVTGWLRRPAALAVSAGIVVQALWLAVVLG